MVDVMNAVLMKPMRITEHTVAMIEQGYAPDLNPVEAHWSFTKHCDLANFLPDDAAELRRAVCDSIRLQARRETLLRLFFHAAKLKL